MSTRLDAGFELEPGMGDGPGRTCANWVDGSFWFETGRRPRKGRNLARDPRCALSVSVRDFDLTVEGEASVVTDPATVARLASIWNAGGWPCQVDESGVALTAPCSTAGPPPWHVHRIDAHSAYAVQTVEPRAATRWSFQAGGPADRSGSGQGRRRSNEGPLAT